MKFNFSPVLESERKQTENETYNNYIREKEQTVHKSSIMYYNIGNISQSNNLQRDSRPNCSQSTSQNNILQRDSRTKCSQPALQNNVLQCKYALNIHTESHIIQKHSKKKLKYKDYDE